MAGRLNQLPPNPDFGLMSIPCFSRFLCTCGRALLLLLLSGGMLSAQDLTAPLLSDSWQATFTNPALYGQAQGRLTVGLPGLSNDLYLENLTYNQLVTEVGDRRILDLSVVPDLLTERNEIRNDLAVETIGVGLRGDRFSVGLYHRLRANGELNYPKTLVQLAAQGNAQFIGQTVEIAPFGQATSYHEIGLGTSVAITDKIHFGARVKYLSGIADVRVAEGSSLRLTTGEENFALTLDQDLTLNSAGTVEYGSLSDINLNYDFGRIETDKLFSDNNGVAFDLGFFADLGGLRLQAAANDLGGSIKWTNEVTTLRFSGTESFTGLDVLQQIFADSISLTTALDTLQIRYEPEESSDPYTTNIAATYLIGGAYDVTDRLTAGLLLMHYARPIMPETAFAVSARYRLLDELTVGLNYNARRAAAANLGAHLYAHLGPVNLLLSTDNLLTVFTQKDNSRASVRLGASLTFGRIVTKEAEDQ